MPLEVAIMIEAQEGLTWDRLGRLAHTVEAGGFDALFRSDHLTGLFGEPTRPSLDCWASLTWLATATRRIRFGPLVCPLSFYHPALLAKRAAAVDVLSGGRLDLGIGAGWHEGEHRMFGIPFPPLKERVDRLESGARAIRALWEGRPVTLGQPYYPLEAAQSFPRPVKGQVPLIIGGKGERRVLKIVAEHANEWNVTRVTREEFRAKGEVLAQHCGAAGRDPGTIRRSLMLPVIIGRSPGEISRRLARARELFPRVPEDGAAWRAAGFLFGGPADVATELRAWEAAGMNRVMLQMLDLEDLEAIDLIAREVLPALR